MTAPTTTRVTRDPAEYAGESLCPRCGSGWPDCRTRRPRVGGRYTHAETCARYVYADDVCEHCDRLMREEAR